mmetsp:Transcript_3894/g.5946  ORF Transcript_3894/g.5946 Transcript_3894/m.5946 type:complete len:220 (+) Transcript_3894:318-977(+)
MQIGVIFKYIGWKGWTSCCCISIVVSVGHVAAGAGLPLSIQGLWRCYASVIVNVSWDWQWFMIRIVVHGVVIVLRLPWMVVGMVASLHTAAASLSSIVINIVVIIIRSCIRMIPSMVLIVAIIVSIIATTAVHHLLLNRRLWIAIRIVIVHIVGHGIPQIVLMMIGVRITDDAGRCHLLLLSVVGIPAAALLLLLLIAASTHIHTTTHTVVVGCICTMP